MGFTIDMISGEIQENSSSKQKHLESVVNPELLDVYQPMPQIQEYVPVKESPRIIPDSMVNIDIDKFIDQM